MSREMGILSNTHRGKGPGPGASAQSARGGGCRGGCPRGAALGTHRAACTRLRGSPEAGVVRSWNEFGDNIFFSQKKSQDKRNNDLNHVRGSGRGGGDLENAQNWSAQTKHHKLKQIKRRTLIVAHDCLPDKMVKKLRNKQKIAK